MAVTDGDDLIEGTLNDDVLDGLLGDDTIQGDYGNDTLRGGGGNDSILGEAGNDDINSGPHVPGDGVGYDIVNPGPGLDVVRGSVSDLDADRIQNLDYGDRIIIEGVNVADVTVGSGDVTIDTNGDGTPEATFSFTKASGVAGDLLASDGGGGTVALQFDPSAAPNAGIGEAIEGPQDFALISNYLFSGGGIAPTDIFYTGAIEGIALLPNGHRISEISGQTPIEVVGIDRGVFLTSGGGPGTSNTSSGFTRNLGEPGDPRLTQTAKDAYPGAGSTNDASLLTFTFNASDLGDQPSISFDVFFGSDEFPEYVNSSFVDIAAIYVNGVNYALFNNDAEQPLSITGTSINTPGNFYNNKGDDGSDDDPFTGTFDTEYDGFSVLLNVVAPVQPGLNTVTIGVADTGDSSLDSGIFVGNIQGSDVATSGSFISVKGTPGNDNIEGNAAPQLISLEGGDDTVTGTPEELDGDVIDGFDDGDEVVVEGVEFDGDDADFTPGTGELDVDSDGDGEPDIKITFEGDFSDAEWIFDNEAGNTKVTVSGVTPDGCGVTLTGTSGPNVLTGTACADSISGMAGNDSLFGLAENDTIDGGAGDDNIGAGEGEDLVYAGEGADSVGGGEGDDVLYGQGGNDFMGGGQGNDTVDGGAGNDVVNGGAGDDSLIGGTGNDTMGGSFGADTVLGGEGDDNMGGGSGSDFLEAGAGNDSVGGGEGDDTIYGDSGNDFLAGGGRDDLIYGGDGDDTINGGDGNDTMDGGLGADQFNFNFGAFTATRTDVIQNFEAGVDSFLMRGVDGGFADLAISNITGGVRIDFDGHAIEVLGTGLSVGDLSAGDFIFL